MSLLSIILMALLFFSTALSVFLLFRERALLKKVLSDISERRNESEKYPRRVDAALEGYLARYRLRDQAYADARVKANESERGATRLSRNIQKSLIYSSDISMETEANRNIAASLFSNVSEGSAAVEEINASIRSLKDKVNIQTDAVNQTSEAVGEINSSLKEVADLITGRTKDIDNLVDITGEGSEKVQASAEVMQTVESEVTDALSLITVIDEIASQTNLLSMNAAIEAAHAGDSGKGFAVVAEEIRKLAESTAENARNISVTLKKLVENIQSAGELSRESEEAFTRIAEGVSQVSRTFGQINDRTEAITINTQEVVNSTVSLQEISSITSLSMNEMELGATEIEKILSDSKEVAEKLDNSMNELSRNSKDINLISTKIAQAFIKSNEALESMVENILTNQSGKTGSIGRVKMNNMILAHVGWVATTRALIDGSIEPEGLGNLEADTCSLGVWIREHGAQEITDSSKLSNLKTWHNNIHRDVSFIVDSVKQGNRKDLEKTFRGIQDTSYKIIEILTTLGYNENLVWDESISVKVELFDNHHKKLIELINKLFLSMEKGEGTSPLLTILDELVQYTEYHFSAEEKAFEKYNYPEIDAHKKQHRSFVAKAKELQKGMREGSAVLSNEVLDFLQDWVVNHIMKVDSQYSAFLSGKNIS
ncbi:bacteriohemerythrin [Spirochaeta isovalerica]|uniref:Hemerythrin-like metal-binding protein n=1 Tax=Spirochaeta isovalerica TaxID=150 RepID=A0A841RD51_9SPIO|nr:bacteriohemerythrin [Spirochaeta isovalerica]MBB6480920.1 hemerythrin-like metal-binding protein [Spirochaeta isovalerica]